MPTQEKTPKKRSGWFYRLVLISATLIWGGTFCVAKDVEASLHATWMVAIRFIIAGIVMAIVFWPRFKRNLTKKLFLTGCAIGVFSFLGYWSQFFGLMGTTPAKNAFLSACYCITVPLIFWVVARRRPTLGNVLAMIICVIGMGLVTLDGDLSISWGDGVSILSAVLYGCEIVAIALLMKDNDVITLTAVQMFSSGIYAAILGVATQAPLDVQIFTQPTIVVEMLFIIIFSSCYASTAQNVAQQHIPPSQVSLLFALESVFATIFSVIFFHEALTLRLIAGFVLIFLAILVSELRGSEKGSFEVSV